MHVLLFVKAVWGAMAGFWGELFLWGRRDLSPVSNFSGSCKVIDYPF